jgi:DNA helicase II / ATP-dependent DNA helicase PcrA
MVYCNKLSKSKEETYDQCKLKFARRYIERAEEDTKQDTSALKFGSYIHKILEDGYKDSSFDNLKRLSEDHKDNYPFNTKKYTESKIEKCLLNFEEFNAGLTETVGTETVYSIEIAPTMELNGVIDRIVKSNNGDYLVIDYKTSAKEATKVSLYNDTQLMGYTYAIHKLYNAPIEKIVCAHWYPLTGNLVTIKYTKTQINAYIRNRISKFWEIKKKKKEQLLPSKNEYCDYCSYKYLCPLF